MKHKILSKEQIFIAIDRLTRFKNPKEKYYRVFYDIILTGTNENAYKKSDLERMSAQDIKKMAETKLNLSIEENFTYKKNDYKINDILKNYENNIFECDEATNILLDNNIEFSSFCEYIDDSCPVNLRWLKTLSEGDEDLKGNRLRNCLKFPVEKVVLAEGLTEEILLPVFSRVLGYDFYKYGVQLIPAGGKNQVVKLYYKLAEELKIPIFILLDNDAEENIKQISPKLRKIDKIHLISCGEFEDLIPKSIIINTINKELTNFASITENDLIDGIPETKNLENIFKEKGLHDFKKADFAKLVRNNIDEKSEISKEIRDIVLEIRNF